jgi:hypothetical protein
VATNHIKGEGLSDKELEDLKEAEAFINNAQLFCEVEIADGKVVSVVVNESFKLVRSK